jgi:hypothetical protein
MTKRTPATDVTLSPSLAEILLELENSYIILLLQAKQREILSPPCLLVNRLTLTSARSAQETQWEKPAPKPLYTGAAAVVHDYPSLDFCNLSSSAVSDSSAISWSSVPTRALALTDSRGDIRPSVQWRSRESRRCDTLPSLNVGRSVIGRDCV